MVSGYTQDQGVSCVFQTLQVGSIQHPGVDPHNNRKNSDILKNAQNGIGRIRVELLSAKNFFFSGFGGFGGSLFLFFFIA